MALNINGSALSVSQSVAAVMQACRSVSKWALLHREINGRIWSLLYIVPRATNSPKQLVSSLMMQLVSAGAPAEMLSIIPLSLLPTTATGAVDEVALSLLPIIDESTAAECASFLSKNLNTNEIRVQVIDADVPKKLTTAAHNYSSPAIPTSQSWAMLDGPSIPKGKKRNLPEILINAATTANGITFVSDIAIPPHRQTYKALLKAAQQGAYVLLREGCRRGDKIALQFSNSESFITGFWACLFAGLIPIPLNFENKAGDGSVRKLMQVCNALGNIRILTGSQEEADFLTAQLGDVAVSILVFNQPQAPITPDISLFPVAKPDELALLLCTSGSTGTPKLVEHTHESILARLDAVAVRNSLVSTDVSLNWFPLDHVGGLLMFHVQDVHGGIEQIQVEQNFILQDPLRWLDLVDHYRVTKTWAPNFAYTLINKRCAELQERHWDLSALRFILNGGEVVVADQAKMFLQLLAPHGLRSNVMHPAWGMSETGSGVTYEDHFTLDADDPIAPYVSVGSPIAGVSVRLTDAHDNLMHEGEVGHLQIKGSCITPRYHLNPDANQAAFTEDGWFRTGDLGIINAHRLFITGRVTDTIIIHGLNYSSQEIENIVEQIDGIEPSYTAAVPVRVAKEETDQLVVFFCPRKGENSSALETIVRAKLMSSLGLNPRFLVRVNREQIPKTSIGKIQRSLLRKQFENGHFPAAFKTAQVSAHTMQPFCSPSWKRSNLCIFGPREVKRYLIIENNDAKADALVQRLADCGSSSIRVKFGAMFAKLSQQSYNVRLLNGDDFVQLLNAVCQDGRLDGVVLFCEAPAAQLPIVIDNVSLNASQERGAYTVLIVLQSLAKLGASAHDMRLIVINSDTQKVLSEDAVCWARAPSLGLLRTAPQELPWLSVQHIDIPESQANSANLLVDELTSHSTDSEVAYRNGVRWIRSLKAMTSIKNPSPIHQGGLYMITGGLGGIGYEIAQFLLQTYHTHLLIVGRTPITEHDVARQRLADLQQYGQVIYEVADVGNEKQLTQAVEAVEQRQTRRLDGVFHLAGCLNPIPLVDLSLSELSRTLQPKVLGIYILDRLLQKRSDALLINFSSLNGLVGGAGVGGYSAANAFLSVVGESSVQGSYRTLSWSMWNGIGMSQGMGDPSLTQLRGFEVLSPQSGVRLFSEALCEKSNHLAIGIVPDHPRWAELVEAPPRPLLMLSAQCTAITLASDKIDCLFKDRFGTIVPVTFDRFTEGTMQPGTNSSSFDSMLVRINRLWQDILELDSVGPDDNFFDLGGHSLLAPRLQAQINEAFSCQVEIVDIFKYPTVREQVQMVLTRQSENATFPQQKFDTVQKSIAAIWQRVLDIETVNLDENFFDLGGHSLLAPQVQQQINQSLNCSLKLVDIFRFPTVRELASCIAGSGPLNPALVTRRNQRIIATVQRRSRTISE